MMRLPTPAICRPIFPIALLLAAGVVPGFSDDEKPSQDEQGSPAVKVVEAVKVDGTFEAVRQVPISAENEHLTDLKLQRIVPYGSQVTKGQALVWFETDPLDEKLRNAETDLSLARLDLESDEFAFQQFLKQQALDKAKAIRVRNDAQQEYDNYQREDRERSIKQAQFSLESAEVSLESATEEYQQLEQMYKEDDLTEESEEIVLRRAKRAMESAAFSLERSKIQAERTVKQSVPRDDANQEDTLARALMDFDKSVHAMAIEKQKRELELQRKRRKLDKQSEDLDAMRGERKKVVLKSEIDGIFVYGEIARGKLPSKPVELETGSSVSGRQIVGTVLDPTKLQVRVDLPEEQLELVRVGVACKVAPKGLANIELDGVVKSVGTIPVLPGKYDCIVSLRGKTPAEVLPAMTCQLRFPDSDHQPDGEADAAKGKSK